MVPACAGEGIVDPIGPAPSCLDEAPFRAELHCIQQFVFTPTCAITGCHLAPGAQEGLDLSDGMTFANIVGVVSIQRSPLLRVEPGNPDDSYLIRKLEGDASIAFDRMPVGGQFLSQSEIDVIREWIVAGAPDD